MSFPRELQEFVNNEAWTYAKTMSKWPHEYLVREHVDEELFVKLINHIRVKGYEGNFYKMKITYCDEGVSIP